MIPIRQKIMFHYARETTTLEWKWQVKHGDPSKFYFFTSSSAVLPNDEIVIKL